MLRFRLLRAAVPLVLVLGLVACDDDDDITGSNGSLARVEIDAPGSATTGDDFEVQVNALNIGVSNIRSGRVDATFGVPLAILSVDTSPGTSASFSNGPTGGRVTWDLGTLDSNSESRLTVRAVGVLAPAAGSQTATIEASLTAQGIGAGDVVASDTVTINP
jgi:hypothetical protein